MDNVNSGKGDEQPLRPSLADVEEAAATTGAVPIVPITPAPKQGARSARQSSVMELESSDSRSILKPTNNARGLKECKRPALILAPTVGELIITRAAVAPVARKATRYWQSFQSFRARSRAARRNKTLDWFEDRAEATKRSKEAERQWQEARGQSLRRNRLEKERATQCAFEFLNENRAESEKMADTKYATSLEQEKIRNYFLGSDYGKKTQMQTPTKQVGYDEDNWGQQRRWRKENTETTETDSVREGDERRKAAAAEHLAEYDRGEVITQALLRIMRRAGSIPGVNAPPAPVEEPPLETDSYLLLRLKKKAHEIGVVKRPWGSGGGPSDPAAERRSAKPSLSGNGRPRRDRGKGSKKTPPPSPESPTEAWSNALTARSSPASLAEKVPKSNPQQPQKPSRPARAGSGQNRSTKKQSSGVFEVDLLRFRSVEEIRGVKLGPPGGENLAKDFSSGACPRLKVLRLGWCSLADRGTLALVRALGGGRGAGAAGRTLQELELRGNAITNGGSSAIWKALTAGALPALRTLDLGGNNIGDDGGKAVAHHLLAGCGTWSRLVVLDLSANGMRDGGVEAVFKAVTAPGAALAPGVEYISLRFNSLSRAARERTARPPRYLVM